MPKSKPHNPSLTSRMNYLIGHLKANLKMIEGGRYCVDVIRQNQAVIAAIKKVNEKILADHLDSCVTRAVRGKSEKEKKRVFQEILEVFQEKN
ncbi:metal-sensing transcriptional repressor [Patescibacteria group bacterium]